MPRVLNGKATVPAAIATLVKAGLLFGSAGTVQWPRAWLFVAVDLAFGFIGALYLYHDSPELYEERRSAAKKAKPWDKKIMPFAVLVLPIATLVLAGLDRRWNLAGHLPVLASFIALPFLLLGYGLFIWAHRSNQFFSSVARIQTERNHRVQSGGPYRFVRHPGYAGLIVASVALPLQLGSLPALIPSGLAAGLYVLRTALEDRMLKEELGGYGDYAARVKYRLVPGLW